MKKREREELRQSREFVDWWMHNSPVTISDDGVSAWTGGVKDHIIDLRERLAEAQESIDQTFARRSAAAKKGHATRKARNGQ